jgi:imidazole glycerol-phosphate synthase subunit HisH
MYKANKNIVIIDYHIGNTGTIANMIKKIGFNCVVSNDIEIIKKANKIILPGVGSFDQAMSNLEELNLISILNDLVLIKKVDILGICLGMQIMLEGSEEGSYSGFGWIKGQSKRIDFQKDDMQVSVPHMGWSEIYPKNERSLFLQVTEDPYFYFLHSYYVNCKEEKDIMSTSFYENEFTSSIIKGNIYGVQFHPERSHKSGMLLLKEFIER